MTNLDEFELDILKSVEDEEWESKGKLTECTQELQSILIRISENDLYELKRKLD